MNEQTDEAIELEPCPECGAQPQYFKYSHGHNYYACATPDDKCYNWNSFSTPAEWNAYARQARAAAAPAAALRDETGAENWRQLKALSDAMVRVTALEAIDVERVKEIAELCAALDNAEARRVKEVATLCEDLASLSARLHETTMALVNANSTGAEQQGELNTLRAENAALRQTLATLSEIAGWAAEADYPGEDAPCR